MTPSEILLAPILLQYKEVVDFWCLKAGAGLARNEKNMQIPHWKELAGSRKKAY